ncbi:MAG: OmpA family protein [Thermoanaerobaculia bacterium]
MPPESGDSSPWREAARPEPKESGELAELRRLLVGSELEDLVELRRRLDEEGLTIEHLAAALPAALALRGSRDNALGRALAPTLERGLGEAVARNPKRIADALFPVMGPAIRMALRDALAGFVSTLNRAIEHSLSWRGLRWRFEAWRSGVPFAQIVLKHALAYRVERVLLVHAETGLLLAHAVAEDLEDRDADLVAAMMSAIRDFVRDSFHPGGPAELRNVVVGDVTVHVEGGPGATLAAAIRGHAPPSVDERLRDTLETIHLRFADPLARFDGDTAPFADTRPLLADCLETVLRTGQAERRSAAPWVVAGATVLLLALLAGWWVWSRHRWTNALERLGREPGIVVTDADRSWRRWRLAGLRDRHAVDPAALLERELGVDAADLETRWEPYLSSHPELVLARARRRLEPPAAVDLALRGETLVVRGEAPPHWIRRLERDAASVPGIIGLDRSALVRVLPPELAEPKTRLESLRIRFTTGSAELDAAARGTLDEVEGLVARLHGAARRLDYDLRIRVEGRTDESGTAEVNRRLSLARAEAVAGELAGRGAAREVLNTRGLGTEALVESGERSVSFIVELAAADGAGDAS